MSTELLEPTDALGKFEGTIKLAEPLYELSMDSAHDAEAGDVNEFGEIAHLFLTLDEFENINDKIDDINAAILYENNQGFVRVHIFQFPGAAQREFDIFVDYVTEFYAGLKNN